MANLIPEYMNGFKYQTTHELISKEKDDHYNELLKSLLENYPSSIIDGRLPTYLDWLTADNLVYTEELQRLIEDESSFSVFISHVNQLKSELPENPSSLSIKMNYAYSVTLMESCLSDMIKHAVLTEDEFMQNALNNLVDFKSIKVPLADIYNDPDFAKKRVMSTLTEYLYHKIDFVLLSYHLILGSDRPESVENLKPEIIQIAKNRHDIVHRNGFDKEGRALTLSKNDLIKAIQDISDFVQGMHMHIENTKKMLLASQ